MPTLEEELNIGPATPIGRGNQPLDPGAQGDAELMVELLSSVIPGAAFAGVKAPGVLQKLISRFQGWRGGPDYPFGNPKFLEGWNTPEGPRGGGRAEERLLRNPPETSPFSKDTDSYPDPETFRGRAPDDIAPEEVARYKNIDKEWAEEVSRQQREGRGWGGDTIDVKGIARALKNPPPKEPPF
mgnify:CR=1 FL=1